MIEKDLILLAQEIEKAGLNTKKKEPVFAYVASELENLKEEILIKEKNKMLLNLSIY